MAYAISISPTAGEVPGRGDRVERGDVRSVAVGPGRHRDRSRCGWAGRRRVIMIESVLRSTRTPTKLSSTAPGSMAGGCAMSKVRASRATVTGARLLAGAGRLVRLCVVNRSSRTCSKAPSTRCISTHHWSSCPSASNTRVPMTSPASNSGAASQTPTGDAGADTARPGVVAVAVKRSSSPAGRSRSTTSTKRFARIEARLSRLTLQVPTDVDQVSGRLEPLRGADRRSSRPRRGGRGPPESAPWSGWTRRRPGARTRGRRPRPAPRCRSWSGTRSRPRPAWSPAPAPDRWSARRGCVSRSLAVQQLNTDIASSALSSWGPAVVPNRDESTAPA